MAEGLLIARDRPNNWVLCCLSEVEANSTATHPSRATLRSVCCFPEPSLNSHCFLPEAELNSAPVVLPSNIWSPFRGDWMLEQHSHRCKWVAVSPFGVEGIAFCPSQGAQGAGKTFLCLRPLSVKVINTELGKTNQSWQYWDGWTAVLTWYKEAFYVQPQWYLCCQHFVLMHIPPPFSGEDIHKYNKSIKMYIYHHWLAVEVPNVY